MLDKLAMAMAITLLRKRGCGNHDRRKGTCFETCFSKLEVDFMMMDGLVNVKALSLC